MTNFRLHHRAAPRYRAGRVFLAGDAAHIHSPAGAQGMHTGIQDAVNLAWRLAHTLRGQTDPAVLDTYEPERAPVGRMVLRFTDRAFPIATSSNGAVRFARVRAWCPRCFDSSSRRGGLGASHSRRLRSGHPVPLEPVVRRGAAGAAARPEGRRPAARCFHRQRRPRVKPARRDHGAWLASPAVRIDPGVAGRAGRIALGTVRRTGACPPGPPR
jgi:FAD binding domain